MCAHNSRCMSLLSEQCWFTSVYAHKAVYPGKYGRKLNDTNSKRLTCQSCALGTLVSQLGRLLKEYAKTQPYGSNNDSATGQLF